MNRLTQYFREGLSFVSHNPQIVYTFVLLLIIPGLFIFSSQWFLNLAQENQERTERERIGMLQDVVSSFSQDALENPEKLQEFIDEFISQNPTVVELGIVRFEDGNYTILASRNHERVGKLDQSRAIHYQTATLLPDRSFIFEVQGSDGRHWAAYRLLHEEAGVRYFLVTDISMVAIDTVAQSNISIAYLVLFLLLLIVLAILIRQARIVDYASLYRKLKEIDEIKDDFISIAAHELRSPLTAIRGYSQILRDAAPLIPPQVQALDRIDISAEQLSTMIEDTLDVAKLQTGNMSFEYEVFKPKEVIENVLANLSSTAQTKGLQLLTHYESDSMLRADKKRLGQVLTNLVGNSLKYTKEGQVILEVSEESDHVVIAVRDTGIGISAEEQQRLFQKFYRVHRQETREIRGTGLGLWITKAMVEAMGGTIGVESMRDVGSRFYVLFPKH